MSKLISFVLLSLATTATAEDLGFRVVIDSPREQRAIVEVSAPLGLSYRLCANRAPGVDCPALGEDLPNTPEARALLDARFAAEMNRAITGEESSARPLNIAIRSMRDGVISTAVYVAFGALLPGRVALPSRRVLLTQFAGWSALSGVINAGIDVRRARRAQKLRPFANPDPGLAVTRAHDPQTSFFFDTTRDMDLVIDAMTRAVADVHQASQIKTP